MIVATRSLSFTRSSPTSRNPVSPSATAAATARTGISSIRPAISAGADVGAVQVGRVPGADAALPDPLDVGAHPLQHVEEARPGGADVDVVDDDLAARARCRRPRSRRRPATGRRARRARTAGSGDGRTAHDQAVGAHLDVGAGRRPASPRCGPGWRPAGGRPSRPRPTGRRGGRPTSPGRWAPAGRSRSRAGPPPRTASGGRRPPSRPSTVAPISRSGLGHPRPWAGGGWTRRRSAR